MKKTLPNFLTAPEKTHKPVHGSQRCTDVEEKLLKAEPKLETRTRIIFDVSAAQIRNSKDVPCKGIEEWLFIRELAHAASLMEIEKYYGLLLLFFLVKNRRFSSFLRLFACSLLQNSIDSSWQITFLFHSRFRLHNTSALNVYCLLETGKQHGCFVWITHGGNDSEEKSIDSTINSRLMGFFHSNVGNEENRNFPFIRAKAIVKHIFTVGPFHFVGDKDKVKYFLSPRIECKIKSMQRKL